MSPNKEICDVLHDDVPGSKLANQAGELRPKTRTCPADPDSRSCAADILAGKSTSEDVNPGGSDEFTHIGVTRHSGPMLGEDPPAERL
jgi:hypothetical protein